MKLILERWNQYLLTENVAYSGVVLHDNPDPNDPEKKTERQKLLDRVDIPEGWKPFAHHMTIVPFSPIVHPKGKHDFSEDYPVGKEITLKVTHVGMDDRAMAVKVEPPAGKDSISKKVKFPHITIAVNREGGGKPFHSNKIPAENFKPIEDELMVRGTVQEVPS